MGPPLAMAPPVMQTVAGARRSIGYARSDQVQVPRARPLFGNSAVRRMRHLLTPSISSWRLERPRMHSFGYGASCDADGCRGQMQHWVVLAVTALHAPRR